METIDHNYLGGKEIVPIHVEVWICSRLLSGKKEIFTRKELMACINKGFSDQRPGISTHIRRKLSMALIIGGGHEFG